MCKPYAVTFGTDATGERQALVSSTMRHAKAQVEIVLVNLL
jgi:hypothetical protein